jgi:hypothetical protein
VILAVAFRAPGLRPAVVHVDAVAARDPLHQAVEDFPARLVLVEAEVAEVVEQASRLRGDLGVDALHVAEERIRRAEVVRRVVFQERVEIPHRRESHARDLRVLRGIRELVDVVGDEVARGELDRRARRVVASDGTTSIPAANALAMLACSIRRLKKTCSLATMGLSWRYLGEA